MIVISDINHVIHSTHHLCSFIHVASANKVQLSEDARNALTPFDCYVMALRGEVEIKVSLDR